MAREMPIGDMDVKDDDGDDEWWWWSWWRWWQSNDDIDSDKNDNVDDGSNYL